MVSTVSRDRIGYRIGESIAELLYAESFLFVQQSGATGLASASLRGMGADHTQVVLDGMVLADPQTGQLDLTSVPSIFVQSVTIHHGGAGISGGRSALGGIVDLQALQAPDTPLFRASGSLGAFGRRQLGALISRPFRTFRSLLAIDVARIDGRFLFENPASITGEKIRREGADRNVHNIYARLDGESRLGTWYAATWIGQGERGVPGPVNAAPVWARQQDQFLRFWAAGRIGIPDGILNLGVSYTQSKLEYARPRTLVASKSWTETIEIQATGNRVLSDLWWVEAHASVGQDRTRLAGGRNQQKLRTRITAERTTERTTIKPSLGVESFWVDEHDAAGVLPSLSVQIRLLSKKAVFFRSSVGRVLRTPTFNERYWVPGGNPDLRSERGWSVDGGLSFQFEGRIASLEAQTTTFWNSLRDKIVWHPSLSGPSIQTWRPANIGRVVSRGIEGSLSASVQPRTGVSIIGRLIYSYSRVEDRSAKESRTYSRQLRYVPEHVLKTVISVSSGPVGLDVILTMIGPRYITSDETQSVSAYQELSVRLRTEKRTSHGKIRLQLALENAADQQIESIRFYPMPPRHMRVSFMYEIGHNR